MAILPLQLARVSNLLRTNVATEQLAQTQQSLLEVQNELSTGKRINAPSDDPGASAIIQQLNKTLEQRQAYSDNLKNADSQLSEVDSTLGDLTGLLQQAQSIASANVGSDVTDAQRQSAAAVVQSIYSQVLSIANKEFEGVYLFGGDRSTEPPFTEDVGGVKFVGSETVLQNSFDENTVLPFMVDGGDVFGALSTRVQGTADVSPELNSTRRLSTLGGATGHGIHQGSIAISNGATSVNIDLSHADNIGDVVNTINASAPPNVTATISGQTFILNATGGTAITVKEVGGGTTAADLGILTPTTPGTNMSVVGMNVHPTITPFTDFPSMLDGVGLNVTGGMTITNGQKSATLDFSSDTTVEDFLNTINGAGVGVLAKVNDAGTGFDILNTVQGAKMTISENGGTLATQLGLRTYNPSTMLGELNEGRGVRTVPGNDITVTRKDGTNFAVDLDNLGTVQDVIDSINTADGGGGVTASFATTGNGIVLTDSTGGAGPLSVSAINFSNAGKDLGIETQVAGNTITGTDINPVPATGIFANLEKLRDSLQTSDQAGITTAAQGLQGDQDRTVRVRGQTGAAVQEMESRQNRLDDQNVATKALLSSLQDTDFTDAISRFQTLQTSLQASLQTTAKMLNLSLLDFLG